MKLFLTSSVNTVATHLVKRLDLSNGNRLVFIDTAAEGEDGDKQWLINDRQSLVGAGFRTQDYTITGKSPDQLKHDLAEFDFIYMSGGNTHYLLEQSQKSGFIEIIRSLIIDQHKTYIGCSAGSIIAGLKLPAYLIKENTLSNTTCYGLVNFTVVPHWGSKDFKDLYLETRLKQIYSDKEVPFILLTDRQYIVVENDSMNIVSIP